MSWSSRPSSLSPRVKSGSRCRWRRRTPPSRQPMKPPPMTSRLLAASPSRGKQAVARPHRQVGETAARRPRTGGDDDFFRRELTAGGGDQLLADEAALAAHQGRLRHRPPGLDSVRPPCRRIRSRSRKFSARSDAAEIRIDEMPVRIAHMPRGFGESDEQLRRHAAAVRAGAAEQVALDQQRSSCRLGAAGMARLAARPPPSTMRSKFSVMEVIFDELLDLVDAQEGPPAIRQARWRPGCWLHRSCR